jgi:hypothetical protein
MVIAGGRATVTYGSASDSELYYQTLDVIQSDGRVCSDHDLPSLPENLEGFGIASKHGRFIYVCGGKNDGMYRLRSIYFCRPKIFWVYEFPQVCISLIKLHLPLIHSSS